MSSLILFRDFGMATKNKGLAGMKLADQCKKYYMKDDKSIITEDGQRLTIQDGLITGTEDPAPGLAFETGNVMDEKSGQSSCPTDNSGQKKDRDQE